MLSLTSSRRNLLKGIRRCHGGYLPDDDKINSDLYQGCVSDTKEYVMFCCRRAWHFVIASRLMYFG